MKTVYCFDCEREIEESEFFQKHVGSHYFASEAERSGVLQGCPPSAGGSAGARASDEAAADSLVRSAEVNGLKALREYCILLQHTTHKSAMEWKEAGAENSDIFHRGMNNAFIMVRWKIDRLLSDAPQCNGERVRLPNGELCDRASKM